MTTAMYTVDMAMAVTLTMSRGTESNRKPVGRVKVHHMHLQDTLIQDTVVQDMEVQDTVVQDMEVQDTRSRAVQEDMGRRGDIPDRTELADINSFLVITYFN